MTGILPSRSRLARLGAWLVAPPDEALADAARDGELLVARVRTWLTLSLLLIPLLSLALDPGAAQHYVGLVVSLSALTTAVLIERALQRRAFRTSMAFYSSIADVSLVSLGLFAFWLVDRPIVTVNSRVMWEVYLIAIAASALRYDPRVTLTTGVVAGLQHTGLTLFTWATHRGDGLLQASEEYGYFSWSTQGSRLIVLGAMVAREISPRLAATAAVVVSLLLAVLTWWYYRANVAPPVAAGYGLYLGAVFVNNLSDLHNPDSRRNPYHTYTHSTYIHHKWQRIH